MRISRILIAVFLLGSLPLASHAQNELDALRFSGSTITGTARSIGVGGAFSAVGADFTAASLNPAGLGLYRRSDFQFTTHFRGINNDAIYLNENNSANRSNFGFSSVGYVYHSPAASSSGRRGSEGGGGLKSWTLSLGFNQIDNYHRNTRVSAYNTESSITDWFASRAQGINFENINDDWYADLAWGAYLIDTSGGPTTYVPGARGGEMQQEIRIEEKGRTNEWSIGLAGNFDDILFGGIALGIREVRYEKDIIHTEEDVFNTHNSWANDSTPVNSLYFNDYFRTRGSGINLKLGLIFRPLDFLRVGVAFQSPTWHSMTDRYYTEVSSELDNDPNTYGYDAQEGIFTYNLSTPYKATLGVMALIKKLGFITADFELTDYTGSRFTSDVNPGANGFYAFTQENDAIQDLFDFSYNFRLGGELRLGAFRLRAGYSNFGSVLKEEYLTYTNYESGLPEQLAAGRQVFTGGFGIKRNSYYLDLAYAREHREDGQLYYSVSDPNTFSPELVSKVNSSNLLMTIGFTF